MREEVTKKWLFFNFVLLILLRFFFLYIKDYIFLYKGTYIIDSSKRQPVAPSREDVSFKVYSLRHKMVRLRRAGCLLYQSDEFSWIIQKIEREIECEMLAVRTEKRIEADIGM